MSEQVSKHEETKKYATIQEGSAQIRYELKSAETRTKGKKDDDGPVFYNKVQVFNRDLSVIMLALFAQWRYVEGAEFRAGAGKKGEEQKAARLAERERLYKLSAAELDALIETEKDEHGIVVLDALAATGLRSIRYAQEVPGVKKVIANDLEAEAATACAQNIKDNGCGLRCEAQCSDAVLHMMQTRPADTKDRRKQNATYDVIDIDPYGSCAPFLDAAVQCIADGGMLCVTSTDMTVLAGNFAESCFSRYGAMPTKAKHMHEFALRIVLHALEANANKYGRHIQPVLSVSIDFYLRVFVRVYKRPQEVKRSCLKRALVLQSTGCPSFYLQPMARPTGQSDRAIAAILHKAARIETPQDEGSDVISSRHDRGGAAAAAAAAEKEDEIKKMEKLDQEMISSTAADPENKEGSLSAERKEQDAVSPDDDDLNIIPAVCTETGASLKLGGPIWAYPIYEADWVMAALDRINAGVDKYLSTNERLNGVLTAVSEELIDVPLYYTLPQLCSTLHCFSPKMAEVRAALAHAGYRSSQSHRDPDAIKTDAPPRIIWDIMRCWCQKHPISEKRLLESNQAAAKILNVEPKLVANFATTAALRAKPKARRWAPNPEAHWGPKAAARGRKRRRT